MKICISVKDMTEKQYVSCYGNVMLDTFRNHYRKKGKKELETDSIRIFCFQLEYRNGIDSREKGENFTIKKSLPGN